ncbi:hypothetical protein [uncultured Amnibacterium sp.]|uniref:hypothetical protein n=1 Tax=uncultured Amnibacterium sp. TaxID=1631851 RepID=UPI0035CBDF05
MARASAYGVAAPFVQAAAVLVIRPGTVAGRSSDWSSPAGDGLVAARSCAAVARTSLLWTV